MLTPRPYTPEQREYEKPGEIGLRLPFEPLWKLRQERAILGETDWARSGF